MKHLHSSGFIALMTTLVMSAILTLIGISLAFGSLQVGRSNLAATTKEITNHAADTCYEFIRLQLANDITNFQLISVGAPLIPMVSGNCSTRSITSTATTITITVEGTTSTSTTGTQPTRTIKTYVINKTDLTEISRVELAN